ncbi:hypothetical protein H5410_042252 [Solanum commersonii]|uniref:Uncharacterized protein n=1 Tax=Solanum commersonii TaxID=4109 RepID=A0A9J5XVH8_SOLCO|nr:hypothetical protein H5410_042252 [Solanum commersonii]
MVREFYVNWVPDARSLFVIMRGVNLTITLAVLNDIGGSGLAEDCDALFDIGTALHRYHSGQGLFSLCLDDDHRVNIGAVLKSVMRKARVHKGRKYAFGGLITSLCRPAIVSEENMDYIAPLFPAPVDITRTKGPVTKFGPTLTTVKCHRQDELIMARVYGLEMLRHQNGCRASTDTQLGDVERHYPLNAHAKALLGIGPEFREPIDDDIPIDEERLRTSSNVVSDSDEEVDPAQAGDEAEEGDAMED